MGADPILRVLQEGITHESLVYVQQLILCVIEYKRCPQLSHVKLIESHQSLIGDQAHRFSEERKQLVAAL